MQLLELAEIQLAEDLSSVRVLEWVPVTWKYTKFAQFWSSLQISWLLGRINSCLENFVFFAEKWSLLALGIAWKFGGKIKFDRMKFVVTDWVAS